MTDYRDRIDRVRAAIRADLAAPLDLDALAEVACLSRFHFARVFRATTGETPAEAVRRARLNQAAVLLVATDEPVDRIAALCGFGHPGSFERAFGRAFGRTPIQVRAGGVAPAPLLPRERERSPCSTSPSARSPRRSSRP